MASLTRVDMGVRLGLSCGVIILTGACKTSVMEGPTLEKLPGATGC